MSAKTSKVARLNAGPLEIALAGGRTERLVLKIAPAKKDSAGRGAEPACGTRERATVKSKEETQCKIGLNN